MSERMIPAENFSPFAPFTSEAEFSDITSEADIEALLVDDQEPEPPGPAICAFGAGRFEVSQDGVQFINGDGAAKRISDELRIEAKTRDAQSGNWGRLLRWRDSDDQLHTWAMPMELLHGDSTEVTRALAAGGLSIVPGQQRRLIEYLQVWDTNERVRCVDQLGWHGSAYCMPDETIGAAAGERIVFQSTSSITGAHGKQGSIDAWSTSVAALAVGNSRLLFAISCAFAGPLLEIAAVESGGFHFMGASSSGKTTALRIGASVWGHPEKYVRQWRATANGLEGLAALHNDGLLILDELSQCDPKQAGEAAYMLANGKGKARASRSGGAREAAAWRILFLSSGEQPLSALMEGIGKKANAGQELRLANVPADAGAGLGMFEDLRGHATPAAFANALSAACSAAHGSVGRAYLQRLVAADRRTLSGVIREGVAAFVAEAAPSGASGQVERVARRFGLIAAAGELATSYGLTGWQEGDPDRGARACFEAWLEGFGAGSHEERAILEQVRVFIEKHGSSRFQSIDAETGQVNNRAGFWKDESDRRLYLVPVATFKTEVIAGFDLRRAVRVLLDNGMLAPGSDAPYRRQRLPGMGPTRVYAITVPDVEVRA